MFLHVASLVPLLLYSAAICLKTLNTFSICNAAIQLFSSFFPPPGFTDRSRKKLQGSAICLSVRMIDICSDRFRLVALVNQGLNVLSQFSTF